MTYTDLESTAALILAKEPSFKNLTDVEIIATRKIQAKLDLQNDLEEIFRISVDNLTSYVTNNLEFLQDMLALRQLFWYYFEQGGGDGSDARFKSKTYSDLYNLKKQKLKSLFTSEVPYTRSLVMSR